MLVIQAVAFGKVGEVEACEASILAAAAFAALAVTCTDMAFAPKLMGAIFRVVASKAIYGKLVGILADILDMDDMVVENGISQAAIFACATYSVLVVGALLSSWADLD